MNPWDVQIQGSHYKKFKIQPLYFCMINNIPFPEGSVIKYILRVKENRITDLQKAKHIIETLIYEEEQKLERLRREGVGCDITGDVQKGKCTIYESGSLLPEGELVPRTYVDGRATEGVQGLVGSVSTEDTKDNQKNGRDGSGVDTTTCRLGYYYRTGE